MKPPAIVCGLAPSGLPPKTATFMLPEGQEIKMRLPKSYLLPDGWFDWDTLPALLILAAARAGYEKLRGSLEKAGTSVTPKMGESWQISLPGRSIGLRK